MDRFKKLFGGVESVPVNPRDSGKAAELRGLQNSDTLIRDAIDYLRDNGGIARNPNVFITLFNNISSYIPIDAPQANYNLTDKDFSKSIITKSPTEIVALAHKYLHRNGRTTNPEVAMLLVNNASSVLQRRG